MTGQIGLYETKLRDLTRRYIERQGYGSTTKLAKEIHRTKTWVSLFVNGERRLGIDDGIAIARALGVDWIALVAEGTAPTRAAKRRENPLGRPLDRGELQVLRSYAAADEEGKVLIVTIARTVAAKGKGRRASTITRRTDANDEARRA